ncbi:MAG: cytoplasmic protein [Pseudomonadota bacterium]
MAIGLFSLGLAAHAATKVPTQTIIVPSDPRAGKDDPTTTPEDKNQDFQPGGPGIPSDALSDPTAPAAQDPSSDAAPDVNLDENGTDEDGSDTAKDRPTPTIETDLTKLPKAVLDTRNRILKAAKTGEIEKLRALIGTGTGATTLSFGGLEGDPIAFLKENSGDDDGFEILAILVEILEMGYVVFDKGTEEELFVWPYFFAIPFDKLTAPQKVELYHILTAGDVEDSEGFGSYIFYRVGITPKGQWSFFVAGD